MDGSTGEFLKRLAFAAGLLVGQPALAGDITHTSDGYTYFHRAGADLATHDTELNECRTVAWRLHQPITMAPTTVAMPNVSPAAAGIGGAIGMAIAMAIQQKMADAKGDPVNIENCMVVRGWQVMALDDAEGKAFAALDAKARQAQLGQWVSAANPPGKPVRAFANEAAGEASPQVFALATHLGVSLSTDTTAKPKGGAKASDGPPPAAYLPQRQPAERPRMKSSAKPPEALKDADLGGVPADTALVALTVKGDAEIAVTLERLGPDAATPAWVDGRPAQLIAARPRKAFAKAGAAAGTTLVYAAPPGRWRLASVTVNNIELSLCMGGPAFEVAAGQVVYAGSFDPDHLKPDMDLGPAKAAFPGLSGLAEKVQPADWKNGAQGACSGVYMYALELPDRPFEASYAVGSHAPAALAAPAMAPAPTQAAAASDGK
jgi:hypothetical protein